MTVSQIVKDLLTYKMITPEAAQVLLQADIKANLYDNRNNGHHVYNVYPSITTNPYISTTTNDPLCKITGAEAPQTLTTG